MADKKLLRVRAEMYEIKKANLCLFSSELHKYLGKRFVRVESGWITPDFQHGMALFLLREMKKREGWLEKF